MAAVDNFFSGTTIEDNDPDYHVIVTDHPYMAELGLSVFTTGVLYKWWDQQDAEGEYINRKIIDGAENDSAPTKLLIGGGPDADSLAAGDKNWGAFWAWRKEKDGSGAYKRRSHYRWDFKEEGVNYAKSDLNFSDFDDSTIDTFENGEPYPYPMKDANGEEVDGISPITNIIALNDYMRIFPVNTSKKKKDWDKQEKARFEFIQDIKTSKYTSVAFSGNVTFNLNLADGTFKCKKTDLVSFKLYLYDSSNPRKNARTATLQSMKVAAPPVDSIGRTYSTREDGENTPFPRNDDSKKVVGDLDTTYNEYTNKWESGTKQIIAKVTKAIPAAKMPTVEQYTEMDNKNQLDQNDSKTRTHLGQGLAMPVSMQNGNPVQWTPNYADTKGCRKNKKKAIVRAFNPDPTRSYPVDSMVWLNKVDGLWLVFGFTSGEAEDEPPVFKGQWDFSYFATNVDFFFRDSAWLKINPREAEKSFHFSYYDIWNTKEALETPSEADSVSSIRLLYNDPVTNPYSAASDPLDVLDGYHQFTSFDFMDTDIGGTRGSKRSLAMTLATKDPLGEATKRENHDVGNNVYRDLSTFGGDNLHGSACGPFFGCVFPDGYNDENITQYKTARDFEVKGKQTLRMTYFNDNDGVAFAGEALPFSDGDGNIKSDPDRTYGAYFNDRTTPIAMFERDDTSIIQLPADIGTNASPSGTHGRPISNLHALTDFFKFEVTGVKLQEEVKNYFVHGRNWLHKAQTIYQGETELEKYDEYKDSAFDFKPSNPQTIQFRPLKAEVYAQFDLAGIKDTYTPNDIDRKNNDRRDLRAFLGGESWYLNGSNTMPASEVSHQRERDKAVGQQTVGYSDKIEGNLLYVNDKYNKLSTTMGDDGGRKSSFYTTSNSWFMEAPEDATSWDQGLKGSFPNGLRMTDADLYWDRLPTGRRAHPSVWGGFWGEGPLDYPEGTDFGGSQGGPPTAEPEDFPAYMDPGGVGVIGAVCTAGSNGSFLFETANFLGLPGHGHGIVYHPSWGGNAKQYDSMNTTDLSVTIYQAWPREQTIYDPRFFAVHHFNPGILDDGFLYEEVEINDVMYKTAKASTTVDLRVPTLEESEDAREEWLEGYWASQNDGANPPGPLLPVLANISSTVFNDGAWNDYYSGGNWKSGDLIIEDPDDIDQDPDSVGHPKVRRWLPEENWRIDKQRRGKLLPYIYLPATIGIKYITSSSPRLGVTESVYSTEPEAEIDFTGPTGPIHINEDNDVHVALVDMVWTSRGTGYAEGDILTVDGFPTVELEITETDNTGAVFGFVMKSAGIGLKPENFFNSDSVIDVDSSGGQLTVINTDEAHGAGFAGYFTQGMVHELVHTTDSKPEIATEQEITQLSMKADNSEGTVGGTGPTAGNLTIIPFTATPIAMMSPGVQAREGQIQAISPTVGNKSVEVLITKPSIGEVFQQNDLYKQYDLFFHFHNDIVHTLLSTWDEDTTSGETALEQFVELNIAAGQGSSIQGG